MKKITLVLILCLITLLILPGTASASAEAVHTITFDVQGIGETPDPIQIADGEKYFFLGRDNVPQAEGYVFHCWVTTLDFEPDEVSMSNTAAYLETPVSEDMTLYAVWYKLVDSADLMINPPVAGDVIGTKTYEVPDYSFEYQDPRPHVVVSGEGVELEKNFWSVIEYSVFWLEDPEDIESTFKGTFENGKTYGVSVSLTPKFGYEFKKDFHITVNNKPIDGIVYADHDLCTFVYPILCGEASVPAELPTSAVREKSTPTSSTPDQVTSSGSNPNAVKTGTVYPVFMIVLVLVSSAVSFVFCRSKHY